MSEITAESEKLRELDRMRKESVRVSSLSKDALLSERGRRCPHCGMMMEPELRTFEINRGLLGFSETRTMWLWPDRHGCGPEMEYLSKQNMIEIMTFERAREIEYQRRLERAGLVGLLEQYTFESFQDRSDWAGLVGLRARVRSYSYAIEQGGLDGKPWLILHGAWGTGKSHLAGAVVRAAVDAGRRECYFRVWGRYLSRLKASWDKRNRDDDEYESEQSIISELTRGEVVAIDDLDKQPPTEWTRGILFDVLNTRYNALRPTILTFNHAIGDRALNDYIGEAVFDRLMQHAYDIIEFNGPSYRQAA